MTMTKPTSAPPASWDAKALEVASQFVWETQRRAKAQCAVLEAMQWAASAKVREAEALCGCGRPGEYEQADGMACNKYMRCKPAAEPASVAQESSLISRLRIMATDYAPGSILRNTIEQAIETIARRVEPHCSEHVQFDIDCLDCSDALEQQRKIK